MDLNTIQYNASCVCGSVALNDMMLSGMETIIYRHYDNSKINKIVVFPMIKIGASVMNIKELSSTVDLYDLLYEVEVEENLKDIEYIRVNKLCTPLDMEITSATHGHETFEYHHLMVELETKTENSELLDLVVSAAENSLFLNGFEYIVYIKEKETPLTKEVHMLINNISLRGEFFSNRMSKQDDFVSELKENI